MIGGGDAAAVDGDGDGAEAGGGHGGDYGDQALALPDRYGYDRQSAAQTGAVVVGDEAAEGAVGLLKVVVS